MIKANKFGIDFWCMAFPLALLFLTHIFSIERGRNTFNEYDLNYIVFASFTIGLGLFIQTFRFRGGNIDVCISSVSFAINAFILYITLHSYFLHTDDSRYIVLSWIILLVYFVLYHNKVYFNELSDLFILSGLVTAIFFLTNVQIFKSEYYDKYGSLINKGENANYFAIISPFILSYVIKKAKQKNKWKNISFCIGVASLILCIYILATSGARLAIVASLIGFLVIFCKQYGLCNNSLIFIKKSFLNIVFILCIVIAALFLLKSIYQINTKSIAGRILIYKVSFSMAAKRNVFGIGFQKFKSKYNNEQSKYIQRNDLAITTQLLAGNTYYCFNEYLQILIELGPLGLIIVAIPLYSIFKSFVEKNNFKDNPQIYVCLGSLIAAALCAMFSYPFQSPGVLISCIFFLSMIPKETFMRKKIVLSGSSTLYFYPSLIILLALSLLAFREYERFINFKKWEWAAYLSLNGNFEKAKPLYKEIYKSLPNYGPFIYNYGAEAFIAGNFHQSLPILETATRYYSHTNLYVYLGNNYKELKMYKDAERCYIQAMYIQPSKFLPKFQLLMLYDEMDLKIKSHNMANLIIHFPVKIPSTEVDHYKALALEFFQKAN